MTPAESMPPAEAKPAVQVRDLCVGYGAVPALTNATLTVPSGVLAGVVGPNGAGKSTLLKAILGLIQPERGSVTLLGQPAAQARRRVAYVPQRSTVDWDFPATVREVVLMGTYAQVGWLRWPGARQHRAVELALAQVGLSELANRPIGALSGGQQQRVFVARALVQDAQLLLLDEPFQGVDAATEQALIEVLRHQRNQGRTVLAVHHDLHTVRDYFDWLVLLRGTVLACGPTAAVFTRANLQAAYGRLLLMPEGLAPGSQSNLQSDQSSALND